jgi:hypothetical protein
VRNCVYSADRQHVASTLRSKRFREANPERVAPAAIVRFAAWLTRENGATALRLKIVYLRFPGLKQPWALGRNRFAVEIKCFESAAGALAVSRVCDYR